MKFVSASILLISLVAATFSNWFIIAAYDFNRQFVSTTLCENKAMPSMHCNGRCFLSKQLAKQQQPTSPLNNKSNEKFEIQLFCLQQISLTNIDIKQAEEIHYYQQQNFTAQQFFSNNFRPPQA